jgi:hypothetical protein
MVLQLKYQKRRRAWWFALGLYRYLWLHKVRWCNIINVHVWFMLSSKRTGLQHLIGRVFLAVHCHVKAWLLRLKIAHAMPYFITNHHMYQVSCCLQKVIEVRFVHPYAVLENFQSLPLQLKFRFGLWTNIFLNLCYFTWLRFRCTQFDAHSPWYIYAGW